jgi:hypothetical protein
MGFSCIKVLTQIRTGSLHHQIQSHESSTCTFASTREFFIFKITILYYSWVLSTHESNLQMYLRWRAGSHAQCHHGRVAKRKTKEEEKIKHTINLGGCHLGLHRRCSRWRWPSRPLPSPLKVEEATWTVVITVRGGGGNLSRRHHRSRWRGPPEPDPASWVFTTPVASQPC